MKNATTLLLTMRGVPQWYYGDEILMHGPEEMVGKGDAWWRTDFPGGWPGDKVNAFTSAGRTELQNEMFDHTRTLMQWRKTSEAVTKGKLMHFMPFGDLVNAYVYFRYTPLRRDIRRCSRSPRHRQLHCHRHPHRSDRLPQQRASGRARHDLPRPPVLTPDCFTDNGKENRKPARDGSLSRFLLSPSEGVKGKNKRRMRGCGGRGIHLLLCGRVRSGC